MTTKTIHHCQIRGSPSFTRWFLLDAFSTIARKQIWKSRQNWAAAQIATKRRNLMKLFAHWLDTQIHLWDQRDPRECEICRLIYIIFFLWCAGCLSKVQLRIPTQVEESRRDARWLYNIFHILCAFKKNMFYILHVFKKTISHSLLTKNIVY